MAELFEDLKHCTLFEMWLKHPYAMIIFIGFTVIFFMLIDIIDDAIKSRKRNRKSHKKES
jgi:hypothetical protein